MGHSGTFGRFLVSLGHFWPFWAAFGNFPLFLVIFRRFRSFWSVLGHLESFRSFWSISGHFGWFWAISVILANFRDFRNFVKIYLQFWAKIRPRLLLLLACCLLLFRPAPKIDFRQELPKDAELGPNFGRYPGDVRVGYDDAPQAEFRRKSFLRLFGVGVGEF